MKPLEDSAIEKATTDESPIDAFRGEFDFLSNFHPHPVTIEGMTYATNEHAFQALKTDDPAERERVRSAATPTLAKRAGRRVTLRPDWDTGRFAVMERVVREKFRDPVLQRRLLETGERELIEGNTWRGTTWGCIRGKNGTWKGHNELGKIFMRVRDELRQASPPSGRTRRVFSEEGL